MTGMNVYTYEIRLLFFSASFKNLKYKICHLYLKQALLLQAVIFMMFICHLCTPCFLYFISLCVFSVALSWT